MPKPMTRKSTALFAATGLALVLPLTACGGGNSTASYCDAVKAVQNDASLKNLDPTKDPETFKKGVEAMKKVAAVAPDAVKANWDSVVAAFDKLASMDLNALKNDPTKAMEVLKSFDATKLQDDTKKITDNVKSECGITLS